MDIAVVGSSDINLGVATAADLTLAGHAVGFAVWPDDRGIVEAIERRGGIEVTGDPEELVCGRLGLARPRSVGVDPAAAVRGADLVIIDVPWRSLERRFADILPALSDGQVVHVNMHGYWPSFRLAPLLAAAGKTGVTLTEGPDPLIAAGFADGIVKTRRLKRNVPVAAFPATRREPALERLGSVYPTIVPAPHVVATNMESMNLMAHAAITLVNIGAFDRAEAAGEPIRYYLYDGPHVARLTDALDGERRRVAVAHGLDVRPFHDILNALYGARGSSVSQSLATSRWLRDLEPLPASIWRYWLEADATLLYRPFVDLAANAGVDAPLFNGLLDLAGAVLARDLRAEGHGLDRLGIAGLAPAEIVAYALDGRRPA